ncbi:hypothetical protein GWK47_034444 [Chionoecetes opilio]|uniref:Uncharacterized protein n=1 Tax=Chionoecetes opilio TaxID=41210 RepID=A0A8J4YHM9_CHIOP|nr:hypothetical protein GWK47_034444 [Chionoecetes opilio]
MSRGIKMSRGIMSDSSDSESGLEDSWPASPSSVRPSEPRVPPHPGVDSHNVDDIFAVNYSGLLSCGPRLNSWATFEKKNLSGLRRSGFCTPLSNAFGRLAVVCKQIPAITMETTTPQLRLWAFDLTTFLYCPLPAHAQKREYAQLGGRQIQKGGLIFRPVKSSNSILPENDPGVTHRLSDPVTSMEGEGAYRSLPIAGREIREEDPCGLFSVNELYHSAQRLWVGRSVATRAARLSRAQVFEREFERLAPLKFFLSNAPLAMGLHITPPPLCASPTAHSLQALRGAYKEFYINEREQSGSAAPMPVVPPYNLGSSDDDCIIEEQPATSRDRRQFLVIFLPSYTFAYDFHPQPDQQRHPASPPSPILFDMDTHDQQEEATQKIRGRRTTRALNMSLEEKLSKRQRRSQEASQPCLIQMRGDSLKNVVLGCGMGVSDIFLCDVACMYLHPVWVQRGGCAFPKSLAPICNLCGDDICVQTWGAAGSSGATEMRGLATTRRCPPLDTSAHIYRRRATNEQTLMTRYVRPANAPQPAPADAAPASAPQPASADEQQPGPSNEPQPGPSKEPLPSLSEFEGFMMDVAKRQGQRSLAILRALGHTVLGISRDA